MFNVHCPIVQQGVTELLSSAQEGERRRRTKFFDLQQAEEWNILTANHHSTKSSELCSDSCPSARLRMSLHCSLAWSRRKWQDGPAAQSSGLWLGLWTQPGITAAVRAAHHGAAKEQPRSSPAPSSSSGAALAASKRAQGAALLQLAPPLLERVSGQYSTSHNSGSCGFHPLQSLQSFYSATRLGERRERNVAVSRGQLSEDKIQWYMCSLYSDKAGNTTLPPKLCHIIRTSILFWWIEVHFLS